MSQASLMNRLPITSQLEALAFDVFGTQQAAHTWLNRPHPLLNSATPNTFASSDIGEKMVRGILISIRYGGVV
jgi:uncharacterized protein (DUF2384 family)